MSKTSLIATRVAVTTVIFWLFLSNVAAISDSFTSISEDELKSRIESLYSPVDLRYTPEVHEIVNTYIQTYRSGSERLIGLSENFFPMYEYVLSDNGIPTELKYLSVVESGLRQNIVSKAGAVGLWQFMRPTGRMYGLTINSAVDERRDLLRSTQAASKYLKDLHEQFGDWTLALAAYNCGPGKVKKVLNRGGAKDYWSIKGYYPKETRRYIPKYVAISYMMSYWPVHGLQPVVDHTKPSLATIKVYDYTKLKSVSQVSGVDYQLVKDLNPAFLKAYIPKNSKGYLLTLPEADMYQYLATTGNWENLIHSPHLSQSLKNRFYMSGSMKKMWQEITLMDKITEISVIVPMHTSKDHMPKLPISTLRTDEEASRRDSYKQKYHKLNAQQSLLDVAQMYHLKLADLITLNKIDISEPPAPGAMIRVE